MDSTSIRAKSKKGKKEKKENARERIADDDVEDADQAELHRREKYLRRAEKKAKRLLEMGLDENGDPLDNFSISKYPVRETKLKLLNSSQHLAINPVVFLLSVVGLWGLVIWSSVNPTGAFETLFSWRSIVAENFDWFLIGSKSLLFFFLLYVTYKYGSIHLGRKDETPEFSNVVYFCMILGAGIGPMLMAFSMSDTLSFHAESFFTVTGYRSQDEIDLFAINLTVMNWMVLNFTPFVLASVSVSLAGLRFHLPMTFRACFYPILGSYTWGWMGDVIDAFTIIVTVLGCSVYLALCTFAISAGLTYFQWVDAETTDDEMKVYQNVIIWTITIVSTITVLYGMRGAIHITSCLAVALSSPLLFLVFVMDDTKFLLNLQVQEFGYFLQTGIFQYNFWTDAFGQIKEGSGRAIDGNVTSADWMDNWIVYYVAWTFASTASVGMFIASISRGRKLWELVAYSFGGTGFYCLVWICVWTGTALRQLRQGKELELLGELHYNNSAHFLVDGSEVCYNVPQDKIFVGEKVIFTNHLPGVTPVCQFDPAMGVINVLNSFSFPESFGGSGVAKMLVLLYIAAVAIGFMAISDASTLMVDILASNGRKNYHWIRRTFWAGTVGAVTTALLSSGDGNSLVSIQSASFAFGFPAGILLCCLPQSIILLCRAAVTLDQDETYELPSQPTFTMPVYGGIFNIMEFVVSLGSVHPARKESGQHRATKFQLVEFVKGTTLPFVSLSQIFTYAYPSRARTNMALVGCYALCYVTWIVLWMASWANPGLRGCMWTMFVTCGIILTMIRSGFRTKYNIRSNSFADLTSSLLLWPQVLVQMRLHCIEDASSTTEDASVRDNDTNGDGKNEHSLVTK